jgi:hypothetical protein
VCLCGVNYKRWKLSADQAVPRLFYNEWQLEAVRGHAYPVLVFTVYFFKISFNILPSTTVYSSSLPLSKFMDRVL